MIEVLTKPMEEIDKHDIEKLISDRVPESENIEFKKTLPSRKENRDDPWIDGEDRIGDSAKNKILREAVAFANAYGGTLLIGIDESSNRPPVANRVNLIPRCAELAERFKMVFRDCVEPNLARIEIRGIPIEDEAGVVIFRVGRSPLSPHRITKTLVCPIRRSDRCEDMTMREIQDMTLNIARGNEKIDRKLVERSKLFKNEFQCLTSPGEAFGYRISAVPVNDDIHLDRVFYEYEIVNELNNPNVKVFRETHVGREELVGVQKYHSMSPTNWRPMLRGTRADDHRLRAAGVIRNYYYEIHCDGLVEIGFTSTRRSIRPDSDQVSEFVLPVDLPIVEFSNLIAWANKIRIHALAPSTEYVVNVEFTVLADL